MNKGRFKSQALLNEQAILSCMIYVDLNPIRADICQSLEKSEYTSVKQRVDQIKAKPCTTQPIKLAQFVSGSQTKSGIPFSLKDYLELTDWTGRCVRVDKRGSIPSGTPKILDQLSLDSETWLETVNAFSTEFHSFVGPEDKLKALCQKQSKKWVQGIQLCRKLFSNKKLCPI